MNNINSIQIDFTGLLNKSLIIDFVNKKIDTTEGEREFNESVVERLLSIIYLWDDSYYDDRIIDAEELRVIVKTNDSTKEYYMKGKYPNSYLEFKDIIGEIYG